MLFLIVSEIPGPVVWCLSLTWKNTCHYYFKYSFRVFSSFLLFLVCVGYMFGNWPKVLGRSIFPFFFLLSLLFHGRFMVICLQVTDSFSSHSGCWWAHLKNSFTSVMAFLVYSLSFWFLQFSFLCLQYSSILANCPFFPITGLNILIKVVFNFVSDNSKICLIPETGLEGRLFFSDCVSLAF